MSVIATAVRYLMAAGITGEELVQAIAEMEAAQPKDAQAERRRARDRDYQAGRRRQKSADSADVADAPALSPFPNEKISNPNPHTHPEGVNAPARERAAFPRPDGVDAQHWTDFLANRKRKRLANTPTAHKRLIADLAKFSDDEWPPGRLVEHAAARGWAAIFDPRTSRMPANDRCQSRQPADEIQNPIVRAVMRNQAARRQADGFGAEFG